ncbi:MAG: hypothetical protein WDO73_20920 [Ignavibacteriota bacterium]
MKAALRVLTALNERQEPDVSDVDELHWYAPCERERPVDELVCDAIQRAMKDRDLKRKAIQTEMRERALVLAAGNRGLDAALPARESSSHSGELPAKLKRLGIALQQAADVMAAAGDARPADSDTAREILESVASDVAKLLQEHSRKLATDQQKHHTNR